MKLVLLFLLSLNFCPIFAQTQADAERFILKELRTYGTCGAPIVVKGPGTIDFEFSNHFLRITSKNTNGDIAQFRINIEFFTSIMFVSPKQFLSHTKAPTDVEEILKSSAKEAGTSAFFIYVAGNNAELTIIPMKGYIDGQLKKSASAESAEIYANSAILDSNLIERLTKAFNDLKKFYGGVDKY